MPNIRKDPSAKASELVQAKLTPGEKAALDALQVRRSAEMEERGDPGDDSFAGWLRWIIRREAKAADIAIDAPTRTGTARSTATRGPANASPRRGTARGK